MLTGPASPVGARASCRRSMGSAESTGLTRSIRRRAVVTAGTRRMLSQSAAVTAGVGGCSNVRRATGARGGLEVAEERGRARRLLACPERKEGGARQVSRAGALALPRTAGQTRCWVRARRTLRSLVRPARRLAGKTTAMAVRRESRLEAEPAAAQWGKAPRPFVASLASGSAQSGGRA
jgi:hypothetical protein